MDFLNLHFHGPLTFGAGDRCLFESELADASCVYLWTVRRESDGAYLIHYIGEAESLAVRHREHLINVLGLNYGIYEVAAARRGDLVPVWAGLWRDRSVTAPSVMLEGYPGLARSAAEYIDAVEVFAARVENDRGLRRHIEGSIARSLRAKALEDRALYPADNRTGVSRLPRNVQLNVTADVPIAGLDHSLEI